MNCCCPNEPDFLTQAANVSNIVVAIASFFLAFYIFFRQRKKENLDNRLQWFKELILEPNKQSIYQFYDAVTISSQKFAGGRLSDFDKVQILDEIKISCSTFRRNFINLIFVADQQLAREIQWGVDGLLDAMTGSAFDPNLNLNDEIEFEEHVTSVISRNKNFLLGRIFTYDGSIRTIPWYKRILTSA
jgi:hypothetical protein